jgi:hypothetical protein
MSKIIRISDNALERLKRLALPGETPAKTLARITKEIEQK